MVQGILVMRSVQPGIAIVEDDAAVRDAICLVLEGAGWRALEYSSGERFLGAYAAGETFLAVVLDPHLPGINGAQIAYELSDQNPGLPILGITAHPYSPLAHATSRAGARVMLTKPVSADSLIAKLRAMIR